MNKAGLLSVTVALASSVTASAQPPTPHAAVITNPSWAHIPTAAELAAYWPSEATAKGLKDGRASVTCDISIAGLLTNCSVNSEEPAASGFGQAALAMTTKMLMTPKMVDGVAQEGGRVTIPIKFSNPVPDPKVLTNPDWVRKPTQDEMERSWPLEATKRGLTKGRVMIKCVVTVRGLLDRCSVVSEDPAGAGFGPAALLLTPVILMKPRTENGVPVGGAEISIPIAFTNPNHVDPKDAKSPNALITYQMSEAFWLSAPTAASVAAHFPAAAKAKVAKGHVVLHCAFGSDGSLRYCTVLQEEPKGAGFGKSALALSKEFKANVEPFKKNLSETHLDVPFLFLDPDGAEWLHRTAVQPHWVAAPSFEEVDAAYPTKAKAAKIYAGTGKIDCVLAVGGKLEDCHVVSEQPSNMDFGQAALKLAPTFGMNPWTVEGLPIDGVRVALPIQIKIDPPASPSATQ